ncbi:lipoprotein [Streptomyces sp. NPDC058953]|uniref:lipoprotein n=1 Tax=unclassified Streptomyces TaxID=2593676 RepID=UPI0036749B9D
MGQHGVRTGLTVGAAALALLATGCGGSGSDAESKSTYDKKAKTQQIGTAGGVCALPVTFDTPVEWKANRVSGEAQQYLMVGLAELVCELDAREGGTAGFIRLYNDRSRASTPRFALERFVSESNLAKKKNIVYRDVEVGPYNGVEVSYEGFNEFWESRQKKTHIGFKTPKGLLVIDVGAMDPIDHDALLPEVDRIKDTLKGS